MRPVSLYVHVPFCRRRCPYCTFYHVPRTDRRLESAFLRSLVNEFESASAEMGEAVFFPTVYVGGGTPSVLERPSLESIVEMVAERLAPDGAELTVEVNPEDVTGDLLEMFAGLGFNRISAGVQSMSDPGQKTLGRCAPGVNQRALTHIKEQFANYNVDLLLGIPGGTDRSLKETLDRIDEFRPPHVSVYCLEPGGVLEPSSLKFFDRVNQDRAADEYLLVCGSLEERGYRHYEVSNFALPGFECRHNLVYWQNQPYLGFGVSAASYLDGERWKNTRNLSTYVTRVRAGSSPIAESERLSPESAFAEALMLALRTGEGADLRNLSGTFRVDPASLCAAPIRRLSADNLIEESLGRIRLTRQGRLLADYVCAQFLQEDSLPGCR